jgi:hypothetical protein
MLFVVVHFTEPVNHRSSIAEDTHAQQHRPHSQHG